MVANRVWYISTLPVILILSGLLTISCEKEELLGDPGAKLVFSSDTLLFDTIFTTIGSATRHLKVYNPYDKSLEISEIILAGGESSPYRINIDGIPGRNFDNIVIKGKDSLYVFVETTIDPNDDDSPLIVQDSIVFITNGNLQDIKLIAWGQDVNIINGEVFETTRLKAGKPYLVYNSMLVDSGHILTLDPGVRFHFHRNSRLYVAGTIIAEGEIEQPVIFEGARTEKVYRNIPGQWEGIWLMPGSKDNRFVNTRIRNAVTGIQADTLGGIENPTLYLANSIIENMTYAGLFARGAVVYSYNTVIANCGYHTVALTIGGDYTFYHCTFANYWNFSSRRTPSVIIGNFYIDVTGKTQLRPISAVFGNTVIHGLQDHEIDFSIHPESGFDVVFSYCLLSIRNINQTAFAGIFQNCIQDINPLFIDPSEFNFRLAESSPAVDAGDHAIGIMHPFDFDGKNRPFGDAPDIGAFEWHEED